MTTWTEEKIAKEKKNAGLKNANIDQIRSL